MWDQSLSEHVKVEKLKIEVGEGQEQKSEARTLEEIFKIF
jgi:hypothetical protein